MFLQNKIDYLSAAEFSSGPTTGLAENFSASYDDLFLNNTTIGLEDQFSIEAEHEHDEIYRLTGQRFENVPHSRAYFEFARELEGNPEGTEKYNIQMTAPNIVAKGLQSLREQNEKIKKLKEQYPQIKTYGEILEGIKQTSKQLETEHADISERAGFWGTVGGFAGGAAASLTARDPLNIATGTLGGWGRMLLTRMATEGLLVGTSQALNEAIGVTQNRRLLGLETSFGQSAENVGYAFLSGALLRGTAEGIATGAKAGTRATKKFLTDKQLLGEVRKLDLSTPTGRATTDALERDVAFDEANPFGDTREAEIRHRDKFEATARELEQVTDSVPPLSRGDMEKAKLLREKESMEQAEDANKAAEKTQNDLDIFSEKIKKEIGLDKLNLVVIGDKQIELMDINVSPKEFNRGKGTEAMNRIIKYADENGLIISLDPATRGNKYNPGTTSRQRLVDFYKRFGFVENQGRNLRKRINYSMYRRPIKINENAKQPAADLSLREAEASMHNYTMDEQVDTIIFNEKGETILQRAVNEFDSHLEDEFEAKWETAANNDGKTADFGLEKEVSLNSEIVSDVRFDENGERIVITKTVKELLEDKAIDDEMLNAIKVCSI